MFRKIYFLFFVLFSTSMSAQSVFDIIANSNDHTILEAAVMAADLDATLNANGPFTVFAPTDAAFEALPEGTIDALLADPSGALTDILLYHALSGDVRSVQLSDGQSAGTINGKDINVSINADGVFINGAQVVIADLVADNGVVHVIDAVLLPPSVSVVDVIVGSEDHNILEAAVLAAGLETTLSGDGPFTIFAPTDAAFEALPEGTIDALLADPSGDLTDILLYHAISGDIRSTDLSDGQTAATINGKDITVSITNEGVFINDAQVTVVDLVTDNGVIHVIDAVLLPPRVTVVDIIVGSEDHNILEAAVLAAGLETTLSTDGPFTIFAPTDAAFEALPEGTIDALLADPSGDLTDILLYHAISGDIRSTDLSDGQTAATINGKDITVSITNEGVFINDAQVTVVDLVTDNGVIHVIDAVLLPPRVTVVDVIVGSEDHNILEAAVLAAGLETTLSGDGPFTIFAPTDAAFEALPEGTIDALLADPSGDLTDILLYHAISGDIRSTDLSDGQTTATINGKDITVSITNEGVFINDAQVTVVDLVTDNGVIHVIDAVLLPPRVTVVDVIVGSEDHNILEAAVLAAGLETTLSGDGPFTIFAPTDAAFEALPEGTIDALLADPSGDLTDILLYHAISGDIRSTDLSDGQTAATINGAEVTVSITNEGIFINDAQVIVADLATDNGVVHVIDAVLLPVSSSTDNDFGTISLDLYPNPSASIIQISTDQNLSSFRIMNISGQTVLMNKITANKIDISSLDKGQYILELSGDDKRYLRKIIKL